MEFHVNILPISQDQLSRTINNSTCNHMLYIHCSWNYRQKITKTRRTVLAARSGAAVEQNRAEQCAEHGRPEACCCYSKYRVMWLKFLPWNSIENPGILSAESSRVLDHSLQQTAGLYYAGNRL